MVHTSKHACFELAPEFFILHLYTTVFTMPFLCPSKFALQKKIGLLKKLPKEKMNLGL
jgi:hypothetical protein